MLQVGTVTVTAKCIQSQTDRADVHGDFNSQQLDELAQPTRTYQGILALIPGIAPPSASSGGTNVRRCHRHQSLGTRLADLRSLQ